jgi:hypothetical protein
MIRSAEPEPAERAISTSPAGTWLDGLRASFEPERKLVAGRLRSA